MDAREISDADQGENVMHFKEVHIEVRENRMVPTRNLAMLENREEATKCQKVHHVMMHGNYSKAANVEENLVIYMRNGARIEGVHRMSGHYSGVKYKPKNSPKLKFEQHFVHGVLPLGQDKKVRAQTRRDNDIHQS